MPDVIAMLVCALLLNGAPEPPLTVRLSIERDGGLSAVQLRLVVEQMQTIWKDARVDVVWGPRAASRPGEARVSLQVLPLAPPVSPSAQPVLAWITFTGTAGSTALLFVSLPAIAKMVSGADAFGMPVTKLTRELSDRLLARAIGRVAAHELGHYLLQNAGHQSRGLMRQTYSANELVGDWLEPFRILNAPRLELRKEIEALARLQAAQ
jgi:hypothetical protein